MKQFMVETHTHTMHSDGSFTVADLIRESEAFGYDGIVMTDHNTSAGFLEFQASSLMEKTNLVVMNGIEWTTYFGHMLVHDAKEAVDWREATPDSIDTHMQMVKKADGLVGIAHPFDMGSPFCTGCHWEFEVKDYGFVDYIEVWNSDSPQKDIHNEKAYELWVSLLQEGYRISCSNGRDWHRSSNKEDNVAVTYLELQEDTLTYSAFKQALRNGNFYISLGPKMTVQLTDSKANIYHMGDEVTEDNRKEIEMHVELKPAEVAELQSYPMSDLKLIVLNNEQVVAETLVDASDESYSFSASLDSLKNGYLRVELVGSFREQANVKIVLSNPIYLA